MTDFELGKRHGYLGAEYQYPNNANYMAGYKSGLEFAEREYRETMCDDFLPHGVSDANADQFYC